MKYRQLEDQEKQKLFALLSNYWKISDDGNYLFFDLKLKNFIHALELMTALSPLVEKHNHHPDFSVGYGYVKGSLQTHTKKTLTALDFTLAQEMDDIFKRY